MLIFEYGNSLDRVCRVLYCNLEVLLADVIPVERDMVRFFERRILCPSVGGLSFPSYFFFTIAR